MNKYISLFLINLLFICCTPNETNNQNLKHLKSYQFNISELEFYNEINQFRSSLNLAILTLDEHISAVSEDHNNFMIEQNKLTHHNFLKRSQHLKETLNVSHVSENLAFNINSTNAVLNAWINSENHFKNLTGKYNKFGISIRFNTENKPFYTVIFTR